LLRNVCRRTSQRPRDDTTNELLITIDLASELTMVKDAKAAEVAGKTRSGVSCAGVRVIRGAMDTWAG